MRFATGIDGDATSVAAARRADAPWVRLPVGNVAELVSHDRTALEALVDGGTPSTAPSRLLAPLIPGKIVAIGLNYMDHIRESGSEAPSAPLIFTKFSTSVVGPQAEIEVDPNLTQRVDWEVELAVVIGSPARAVSVDRALDHVFGYTVANDVSARDLQFADGQWVRAKSLDTFCPLGPVVVTPDEIGDPQSLELRTRVNGITVQDSSTGEMIFGVAELIAYCSQSFTLLPGDVLLTGTPWGCGEFMSPQRHLQPGDVVEVEIPQIGVLQNRVVERRPHG